MAPKLKQPESRLELQQLAEDYERLARFAQSAAAAPLRRERFASKRAAPRAVWLIVTDNSLDN